MSLYEGLALVISALSLAFSGYAVWMQRGAAKPRIRVALRYRDIQEEERRFNDALAAEVFNDGFRPVTLDDYGFELHGRFRVSVRAGQGRGIGPGLVVPYRFTVPSVHNADRLPCVLEPGKKFCLWLDPQQCKGIASQASQLEIAKQARLIVLFRDQLGHTYRSKPLALYPTFFVMAPEGPNPDLLPWR